MIDMRSQKGNKDMRDISVMRDIREVIGMKGKDTIGMKEMIEAIEKEIGKEVTGSIEAIVEIGTKEVIATREVIDREIIETNTENSKAARTDKEIAPTHPKITEVVHRNNLPIRPATAHTSLATVTYISH